MDKGTQEKMIKAIINNLEVLQCRIFDEPDLPIYEGAGVIHRAILDLDEVING